MLCSDCYMEKRMLGRSQMVRLVLIGAAFWIVATLAIRLWPRSLTDPVLGAVMFATTLPIGWLSVRLTRSAAALSPDQLPAGVMLAGAAAMLVDGAVLHWAPQVYGAGDLVVRLGAAWLLWGYGVSFAVALVMSARPARPRS